MNTIIIMGHLGGDPESRFIPNGTKVTTFNVASNSRVNGQDVTIWYRVVIWGERFDKMMPHFKKGSAIIVTGELRRQDWTDKEGRAQVTLEVHAENVKFSPFGRPNAEQGAPQQQQQSEKREKVYEFAGNTGSTSNTEDDLPF